MSEKDIIAKTANGPITVDSLTVDLAAQTVSDANGVVARFEIDPFRKKCLLEGLDRIGLTLKDSDAITAYERKRWPDLARAG